MVMHLLSFSFILQLPDGQCVKLRKFLRCAQSTVHKYIKTALTGGFLHDFSAALNGADIFLELAARAHDLMPAAEAFELEISAGAQHLPILESPAKMASPSERTPSMSILGWARGL